MKRWKVVTAISTPIISARFVQTLGMLIGNLMVAQIGFNELAASALTSTLSITFFTFASGVLFAASPLISIAYTKKQHQDCHVVLKQSYSIATLVGVLIIILLTNISWLLKLTQQPPNLTVLVQHFFYALAPAILPMLWITALQQYLIGIRQQKIIFYYSVFRLILGTILSYIFIFGEFHIPRLGLTGLGIAISVGTWIAFFILIIYLKCQKRFLKPVFFPKTKSLKIYKFAKLGLPIGLQMAGEIAALLAAVLMLGYISKVALATQQITSQYLLLVTMIAFGMAQALAVISGKFSNRNNWRAIKRYTVTACCILSSILVCIGIIYIIFPYSLAKIYFLTHRSNTSLVSNLIVPFFLFTAFYQLFDGLRNLLTGGLRGIRKTFVPMIIGLLAFWIVGLPLGYCLSHIFGFGAKGIPLGMTIGVILGTVCLWGYYRRQIYLLKVKSIL